MSNDETTSHSVLTLVEQLGSPEGTTRQRARLALVEMGADAVPALLPALDSANEHQRWEAAKALSEIPDARATDALVRTLEDQAFGVRWLAAEALIGIGEPALVPLLKALIERPDSPRLRDGAGHILRAVGTHHAAFKSRVAPVLEALDSIDPANSVPWASRALLKQAGLLPE